MPLARRRRCPSTRRRRARRACGRARCRLAAASSGVTPRTRPGPAGYLLGVATAPATATAITAGPGDEARQSLTCAAAPAAPRPGRGPGLTVVDDPRARLALALDVDDLVVALRLARRLRPWFSVAKVGLELFGAAGPEAVSALTVEGYRVFLDLKLHDIPDHGRPGPRGCSGAWGWPSPRFTRRVVRRWCGPRSRAWPKGRRQRGHQHPACSGSPSSPATPTPRRETLASRATVAAEAGCGGLVCAASDLAVTRRAAPGLLTMVPGIRPSGTAADDQARASTPAAAIAAGADILVIGRAVTAAEDPEAMAAAVADEVASSIASAGG